MVITTTNPETAGTRKEAASSDAHWFDSSSFHSQAKLRFFFLISLRGHFVNSTNSPRGEEHGLPSPGPSALVENRLISSYRGAALAFQADAA